MDNNVIFIKTGTAIERVNADEIYAVISEGNYCTIKTVGREYVKRTSLVKMSERLEDKSFVQVNKSTLLPIHKIDHVNLTLNKITIAENEYHLSRNFRKNFLNQLDSI